MISCYPQNGEELLTSRQLREKADKIMSEIPGFQDRLQNELSDLLDEIRKCASSLDNPKIAKHHRILMMERLSHMSSYAASLATRLANLAERSLFLSEPEAELPNTTEPEAPKPAGAICPTDTWRSRGDTDDCVGTIQRALLCAGFDVKPDAVFGRETRQVVMHFQEVHGLTVDGVVGPKTWVALNRYLGGE